MMRAAPDRVAVYGIENRPGTPVYVHAKVCIVDDTWTTIGSDNFNRRSWTHDSELSAVVLDRAADDRLDACYARTLRLTLAAEHLDRPPQRAGSPLEVVRDCLEPAGMFRAFAESAARLDAWHEAGCAGPRPAGRLRRVPPPRLGAVARAWATVPYLVLHDPDGRPGPLRKRDAF